MPPARVEAVASHGGPDVRGTARSTRVEEKRGGRRLSVGGSTSRRWPRDGCGVGLGFRRSPLGHAADCRRGLRLRGRGVSLRRRTRKRWDQRKIRSPQMVQARDASLSIPPASARSLRAPWGARTARRGRVGGTRRRRRAASGRRSLRFAPIASLIGYWRGRTGGRTRGGGAG
ncbi:proline-rich receptor-like protein kinase PERK2 [Iris pallida]|uniref:Proline-rich receptor-like protein kinase PERK2 n=1 Tax=Iris pallida TaxID=29817 RepID=A0AAX6H6L4_IRIPA|nr:proline-rich receptor-like protein kinase PERK2 [Iris pallida]